MYKDMIDLNKNAQSGQFVQWPAPSWLDSSVGRVLHLYDKGHGFKSQSGLIFFQALISQLLKLCA